MVVGLAGSCGLDDVGKAAFSLCELVDRYGTDRWDTMFVAVHLNAISGLRDNGGTPQSRAAILDGLNDRLDDLLGTPAFASHADVRA